MLKDLIPSNLRKPVYGAYAAVGVVIGAIDVGYRAAETSQPTWLGVTIAVFLFVGGAIGALASGNTPPIDSDLEAAFPPDLAENEDFLEGDGPDEN